MRRNPYRIGKSRSFGISPRIKRRFNKLPTLKGYEGRWWRRALIAAGVVITALIVFYFIMPERSLMASVEVKRIENKGVLSVGVRDDMPGFCENGEGLEAELALLLAEKILPDSDDPLRLVSCTSKTVSTKLKDGSIDAAIALQSKNSKEAYAYSYPYFSDPVYLVTLDPKYCQLRPDELIVGYIPSTPAGSAFADYVKEATAAPERTLIDKILGRPAKQPDPSSVPAFDTMKYGSYDELLNALRKGEIEAAVLSGAYVHKFFDVYSEETGVTVFFLCDTVVAALDYCIVTSSDEPALAQIADMLIYKMQEDGSLASLKAKYGLAH